MKNEEYKSAPKEELSWFAKTSTALKKAWKFANEFNLLDKFKDIKIPQAVKISGLALLLSSKNLDMKAASPENSVKDANANNSEIVASTPSSKNSANTISYRSAFKAYPGKYYNEICNGSPCWLSSTFETNGAGIGKNPSSIATWNDNGNYRGLNQIDPHHAKNFLTWLETQSQFQSVYISLKKGGVGKANWQKTAKEQEHLMTEAFEWYMVKEYNADNFKSIQNLINKEKVNVSIKKLHPAIISVMHQLMVQRPARRGTIANKIINFYQKHNKKESALNSVEFIKELTSNKTVQNRAITLLNDSSIFWKVGQFDALLSKVSPVNGDTKSWFDERKESHLQIKKEAATKRKLAKASKEAQEQSKQTFQKVLDKAKKFTMPTTISTELNLARKQLSTQKSGRKKSEKQRAFKQDIIDNRLLNSKKQSNRS